MIPNGKDYERGMNETNITNVDVYGQNKIGNTKEKEQEDK